MPPLPLQMTTPTGSPWELVDDKNVFNLAAWNCHKSMYHLRCIYCFAFLYTNGWSRHSSRGLHQSRHSAWGNLKCITVGLSQFLTFIFLEGAKVYSQTGWKPWSDFPPVSVTALESDCRVWEVMTRHTSSNLCDIVLYILWYSIALWPPFVRTDF